MKTIRKNNDLENIYQVYCRTYNKEENGKKHVLRISGAMLGEDYLSIDLNRRYSLRHSFATIEGEYLYLQLECEQLGKAFEKAWKAYNNIYVVNEDEIFAEQFDISLVEGGCKGVYYVKIHSQLGIKSLVGKDLAFVVVAGKQGQFVTPQYNITILNMDDATCHLTGCKYSFASSNDNHITEYISFEYGKHKYISFNGLCDNKWIFVFDRICNALEYEIVLTDENDTIIHRKIKKFEIFTADGQEDRNYITFSALFQDSDQLKKGTYTCTITFMGKKQIEADLVIGGEDEVGRITSKISRSEIKNITKEVMSDAMTQLDSLIGLEDVKRSIKTNYNYMLLMKAREKMGLPHGERILNMVFMGNPGTGKTMVCRLMGSLLKEIGILSKGHVVEVNRECLIGQYIGESEKRTKSFIEQAKGGILFIDEAYSLVTREDHDRDFGRRVLDTLMTHLSEPSNDLLVVMAGYTNDMKFLMNSNPGLASRFPIRFEFPDYTPEELMQICQLYFDRYHYQITDDAKSALLNILMNVVSIPNYGNGRYVKTLIENQIIPNMANRIASDNAFADPIALIRIEKADIPLYTSIKEPYRKIGFNVE